MPCSPFALDDVLGQFTHECPGTGCRLSHLAKIVTGHAGIAPGGDELKGPTDGPAGAVEHFLRLVPIDETDVAGGQDGAGELIVIRNEIRPM